MKQYKLIALMLVLAVSICAKADGTNDKLSRSVMAASYLPEYAYETAEGEASAQLIITTFKTLKYIPPVAILGSASDKANTEKLVQQLKQLLASPPTWAELHQLEKNRLLLEDKALRRVSKYKTQ